MDLDSTIDKISIDDSYVSSDDNDSKNNLVATNVLEVYIDMCELHVKSLKERFQKEVSSRFKGLDEK